MRARRRVVRCRCDPEETPEAEGFTAPPLLDPTDSTPEAEAFDIIKELGPFEEISLFETGEDLAVPHGGLSEAVKAHGTTASLSARTRRACEVSE